MRRYRRNGAGRDSGFTLIEILIVVLIIGLLAGMTTTVLVTARQSARSSVVASQMAQLSMALDDYKNKYGEYPPDFSDQDAVMRHINKRWPRYRVSYSKFLEHVERGCRLSSSPNPAEAPDAGTFIWNIDPDGLRASDLRVSASALVFWLGGLPDKSGKPSGFYANPKAPLGYYSDDTLIYVSRAIREKPSFAFDAKNIGSYAFDPASGVASPTEYVPGVEFTPALVQGGLPIVYFRPSFGVPYGAKSALFADAPGGTVSKAVPYARFVENGNYVWYEEKRFQLIHPGVDGYFGPDEGANYFGPDEGANPRAGIPTLKGKAGLYPEDDDNVVNFATAGRLESEYDE